MASRKRCASTTAAAAPAREAAAHGDVKIVEKLLAIKGFYAFAADEQGTTAMHLAAQNGHKECFAELVKVKCRLGRRGSSPQRPRQARA